MDVGISAKSLFYLPALMYGADHTTGWEGEICKGHDDHGGMLALMLIDDLEC